MSATISPERLVSPGARGAAVGGAGEGGEELKKEFQQQNKRFTNLIQESKINRTRVLSGSRNVKTRESSAETPASSSRSKGEGA